MSGYTDKVFSFFKLNDQHCGTSSNGENDLLIYHELFRKKDIGVEKGRALFFKEQVILLVTLVVSTLWSPQKVGTGGGHRAKEVGVTPNPCRPGPNRSACSATHADPAQRGRHAS